jgi:hypothetical protein
MTYLSDFGFHKYLFANFDVPETAVGKSAFRVSSWYHVEYCRAGDERRAIRNMLD